VRADAHSSSSFSVSISIVLVVSAARVNKKAFCASSRAGVLVSWDSRVLVNSEKFSLFFNGTVQMKIAFVTFFFQKSNTSHDERDTLFKERDETPRANHHLSLSLSVRALKTHLLWTKERKLQT
jgi:hypothetical protein